MNGPTTQPYRNQHAQLMRLASAIPVDVSSLRAREVTCALDCLKSVLIVHLKLQDGMLYPWIAHHRSSDLREMGRKHRELMHEFLDGFLAFHSRWVGPDAVAADPDAFVAQWARVLALLRLRLRAEASDLYRLVDENARLDCPAEYRTASVA